MTPRDVKSAFLDVDFKGCDTYGKCIRRVALVKGMKLNEVVSIVRKEWAKAEDEWAWVRQAETLEVAIRQLANHHITIPIAREIQRLCNEKVRIMRTIANIRSWR